MHKISIINDEISDDFQEALMSLKQHKLRDIELRSINGKNILDLSLSEIKKVDKLLRKDRIRVTCLASPILKWYPDVKLFQKEAVDTFGFDKIITPDESKKICERAFLAADILNAKYIRIFSFLKYNGFKLSDLYQELDKLLLLAKKYNKVLLLENEPACNIHSMKQFIKVLKKYNSEYLRGLLDIGNIYKQGDKIRENEIKDISPFIAYAHIKDFSFSSGKYISLGKGDINYKRHLFDLNRYSSQKIIYSLETHTGPTKKKDTFDSYNTLKFLLKNENNLIRHGIIGCGHVHKKHIEGIKQDENSVLVGVFDTDERNKEISAKVSDSYAFKKADELIDAVDVVILCTPHNVTKSYIDLVLNKNKKCLCEKPVLLKYNKEIANKSKSVRYNSNVFVVLQNRQNAAIKTLKEIVTKNKLGKLSYVSGSIAWPRDDSYYQNSWRGKKKSEGGILFNQGIHLLDLIFYLIGDQNDNTRILYSHKDTINNHVETEDFFTSAFYINKIFCNIEVSTSKYLNVCKTSLRLVFKNGIVSLNGKSFNEVDYVNSNDSQIKQLFSDIDSNSAMHNIVISNLSSFLINKKTRKEPPVFKDIVNVIKFINELYSSTK